MICFYNNKINARTNELTIERNKLKDKISILNDNKNLKLPYVDDLVDFENSYTQLEVTQTKNLKLPYVDEIVNFENIHIKSGMINIQRTLVNPDKDINELSDSYLAPVKTPNELHENRSQPRLNVSTLITVRSLSNNIEWRGSLSNISWGGARIHTKELIGDNGDSLGLLLPCYDGGNIDVQATIIDSWESGVMHNTSVRFSLLNIQDEQRLNNMLEVLLKTKNDIHHHDTYLAHCIDVTFGGIDELKSTLEDLSRGGMKITMPEPVEINKSIQVQLGCTDDSYNFNLRCHVICQDTIEISGLSMYQMGLKLEHPIEELHAMVDTLMQQKSLNSDSLYAYQYKSVI